METIESKQINDWLKIQGNIPLRDEPLFRLVWSDDQYENRKVTGYIYKDNRRIAVENKVEFLPKYPWCLSRWILEQWEPPEKVHSVDLPDTRNGSYEPKFVFENNKGVLPLLLEPVQFLINILKRPASSSDLIRSTIKQWFEDRDKRIEKQDMEVISSESTPLSSLLHHGEAIIVPAEYDIVSPNLRNKND